MSSPHQFQRWEPQPGSFRSVNSAACVPDRGHWSFMGTWCELPALCDSSSCWISSRSCCFSANRPPGAGVLAGTAAGLQGSVVSCGRSDPSRCIYCLQNKEDFCAVQKSEGLFTPLALRATDLWTDAKLYLAEIDPEPQWDSGLVLAWKLFTVLCCSWKFLGEIPVFYKVAFRRKTGLLTKTSA